VGVVAVAVAVGVGTDGKNSLFNKAIIIYNWHNRNHLLNTSGQPTQIIAIHLKNNCSSAFCFSVFPLAFSFSAFFSLNAAFVAVHGCGERGGLCNLQLPLLDAPTEMREKITTKNQRTQDFLYTLKTFALHFSFSFIYIYLYAYIHSKYA